MAEDGEYHQINTTTISTVTNRKRSKIITATESTQEANKDAQLVKMFCVDLGPYYILKYNGFQEFIKNNIPNYTLPSMKKFSKELIPEQYNRAKADWMKTLESVGHVAISIDTWKWPDTGRRNARNMWTATIHVVQQGKLISQNLFTMEANFRTEKHIAIALTKELAEWGLIKKVVCFITNNGKNDKLLEKAVTDSFKVAHVFCTAALINCVIEEAFQDLRFREFEKKYHKNNSAPKSKKKDEPFSWHFLYNMLKDIVENNAGEFTADERRMHSECVQMLKPFEDFNKTLSSQQYLTLSYIFPLIADVTSKIRKCSTHTAVAADVKKTLLDKIYEYFKDYESNPTTANATFMDPRFKKSYFTTREKAESVQQDIINEFNEYVNSIRNQQDPIPSTSNNQSEENGNVLGASTGVDIGSVVRGQVIDYAAQRTKHRSEDPFKFWEAINDFYKESPANLYIMSQKYLCIPATAIPVETISGEFLWKKNYINYNERRTSLEFKNIDKMLFLHSYYRNTEINN